MEWRGLTEVADCDHGEQALVGARGYGCGGDGCDELVAGVGGEVHQGPYSARESDQPENSSYRPIELFKRLVYSVGSRHASKEGFRPGPDTSHQLASGA